MQNHAFLTKVCRFFWVLVFLSPCKYHTPDVSNWNFCIPVSIAKYVIYNFQSKLDCVEKSVIFQLNKSRPEIRFIIHILGNSQSDLCHLAAGRCLLVRQVWFIFFLLPVFTITDVCLRMGKRRIWGETTRGVVPTARLIKVCGGKSFNGRAGKCAVWVDKEALSRKNIHRIH